jgi:predicted nicotinamide N-methyase
MKEETHNNINYQPRVFVGTDDFYDLLINSDIFVDKSLMIKELLEDSGKVVLITRPRRWGKSLNRPDTKDRARSGKVGRSAELRNDFHS